MSPELPIVSEMRRIFEEDLLVMAALVECGQILDEVLKLRCLASFAAETVEDFMKIVPVSRGGKLEGVAGELAWGDLIFRAMSVEGGREAMGACTAWFKQASEPVILIDSMGQRKKTLGM